MRIGFYDEGTFMDARGTRIFYRVWRARRTKSVAALFHALGLHSGRYTWFCEELASRGISCYAVDLFGYGLSEGPRGGNLRGVLDSGEKFLQLIVGKCKASDLIVAGHGSGVLVALHAARTIGLNARALAITPLHEISAYLHRVTSLKMIALLNLRTKIHPRPLYDIDHSDAQLEAEEDKLIVKSVPAKLVLQLIELAKNKNTVDNCVAVFETGWEETDNILAELYSCEKKFYFDPRSAQFPFDEIVELLLESGGPPNR